MRKESEMAFKILAICVVLWAILILVTMLAVDQREIVFRTAVQTSVEVDEHLRKGWVFDSYLLVSGEKWIVLKRKARK